MMEYQDPVVLRELAHQKEREWKDISEKRLQALEDKLVEKDKLLLQNAERFHKLKEDFKYNLMLLEERDQELERYDIATTEIKAQLNVRTAELSELRMQLDDMKKLQEREQRARDELHTSYQQRLRENQAEIEAFKSTKNGELQKERSEFESLRRKLQSQLTELEAESVKQRHELSTEFDDVLKKREHEFRVQVDEMSSKVLEYDLKAQLLTKELELVRVELQRHNSQTEEAVQSQHELEKQLKRAQWQLADTVAMKDARIKELEDKVRQLERISVQLQEDFQRKYAELDKSMREREASAQRVKLACDEKEQALVKQVHELESKLEDSHIQKRQLQWSIDDMKKDHALEVEKLQEENQSMKARWDSNIKEMSRDTVTRDVELQAAQEEISRLQSDLSQRKDDLHRYKKDLQQAVEHEKALEQAKTQLDLDWQRRCEELERRQYDKSENLIATLTRGRDEALATAKERGRELEQTAMLLRTVTRDRDLAMATLKKHDIPLDKNLKLSTEKHGEQELDNLRDQNASLRMALAAMRQQMESLGHAVPSALAVDTPQYDHDNEYIASLEKEVKELKKEKRDLAEKVAVAEKFGRLAIQPPSDSQKILDEVKDVTVRSHIQSLNNALGVLRGEKVELAAMVKKQQARIHHLETAWEDAAKKPQELQVTIEQLKYEASAHQHRHAAEAAALNQRVTQLEGQLAEAQREADMYHQASVENNAELTALRNQVSTLKIDMAEKRPAINFGAQELLIQQLQEELNNLRHRAGLSDFHAPRAGDILVGGDSVSELRTKLHRAAKHIAQLVREKQQLIELSNKLQAELKQTGIHTIGRHEGAPKGMHLRAPVNPFGLEVTDRLTQLERLQYELTKQELQYAQRFTPQHPPDLSTKQDQGYTKNVPGQSYVQQSMTGTVSSLRASDALELTQSSAGGQSLQDLWKLLDSPASPDILSSRTGQNAGGNAPSHSEVQPQDTGDIIVSGQQVKTDRKGHNLPSRTLSNKTAGRVLKVKTPQHLRVRNYNVKSDSGVR